MAGTEYTDNTETSGSIMVVHGPEAFDRGDAGRIFRMAGPSQVTVAGVMARTAAEESGIPCECPGEPPSVILNRHTDTDDIFILNHGKSGESGRIFGEIVAGRIRGGMVHLECADSTVYLWNEGNEQLAERLSGLLDWPVVRLTAQTAPPAEERLVRGCIAGEPVFVNGIVVGYATGDCVTLGCSGGKLIPVSGITVKPHGLEKLERNGDIDLAAAWCKSGAIRSAPPKSAPRQKRHGRIQVIDHAGCELYRQTGDDVCGVLSIGDDTTAVCGHICSHLGIPVFGVTDGDGDGIVNPAYPEGSVVVEVINGRDDDIGAELASGFSRTAGYDWEEWTAEAIARLKENVRITVDNR